jgi:hypothetical protein
VLLDGGGGGGGGFVRFGTDGFFGAGGRTTAGGRWAGVLRFGRDRAACSRRARAAAIRRARAAAILRARARLILRARRAFARSSRSVRAFAARSRCAFAICALSLVVSLAATGGGSVAGGVAGTGGAVGAGSTEVVAVPVAPALSTCADFGGAASPAMSGTATAMPIATATMATLMRSVRFMRSCGCNHLAAARAPSGRRAVTGL